ncbi:ferric reductase NAD binding domain-containing protein [Gymnopilus junonius]|uniref:ferric-chelate reductase (NADPH) n=1 Tax=Gymnopilus junonius TaxID=109634 RepID=A0A9P5P4Q7_GYMJU|nr:ferric reductase NAD binding domain-containing protein [Gymnopilus junonius]
MPFNDSSHIFAAIPSSSQRSLRNRLQIAHVRQLWIFLGSVLAFFTAVNFLRYLWSKLFPISKGHDFFTKEKIDEETSNTPLKQSTCRRSLSALTTGFRIVFFRWSVPIGPSVFASVTELSFTFIYIAAMLIWLLVDTQDLQALFYQDRAALMASCQLPLVVALAGKNNVISWLTGISHERLNVLHRASARTIMIFLWIHALARVVSGLPKDADFSHDWMRCGALSLASLTIATILSVRPIRQMVFEFFLVTHIVCVLIFIVAGYYHAKAERFGDYIWPALLVWGFDRGLRMARLVWNNKMWSRSHPGDALVELVSEDTIRLTLHRRISWLPGQHAYVILPTVSNLPFEAHPFTIASIPESGGNSEESDVIFLIRGRGGFTQRLREHAAKDHGSRVPAFLDGPYGCPPDLRSFTTCILIAGGSGISYTLPLLLDLVRHSFEGSPSAVQRIVFVWAVRDADHLKWISTILQEALARATKPLVIEPRVYVTGKNFPIPEVPGAASERASVSSSSIEKGDIQEAALPVYSALKLIHGRPSMKKLLSEEIEASPGAISVDVAGPTPLSESIRRALSSGLASPASVLKGSPPVTLHVETFGMN